MTTREIYFKQLELGPMQNFIYLIGDPNSREAAVVDPGWDVPRILETLQADGYRLAQAIVTHSHFDHVMGLGPLLDAVDMPVYANREEVPSLELDPSNLKPVEDGEVVHVGEVPITLLHTPGHTPGSQCLLVEDRLLSGDTLFIGGCGRCDLPGGDPRALFETLTGKLKRLDDRIQLFPGHNYAPTPHSTMGEEKKRNPFLQPETVEQFLNILGMVGR